MYFNPLIQRNQPFVHPSPLMSYLFCQLCVFVCIEAILRAVDVTTTDGTRSFFSACSGLATWRGGKVRFTETITTLVIWSASISLGAEVFHQAILAGPGGDQGQQSFYSRVLASPAGRCGGRNSQPALLAKWRFCNA